MNYSRWGNSHTTWFSAQSFISSNIHLDGVHTVPLGNTSINILVSGNPFVSEHEFIPVFFNGAISNRSLLTPPFFSGTSIAKDLNLPFISISDPLTESISNLGLAWYTGNCSESFQYNLTNFLTNISESTGKKLLFIGGSGGGFASIYYSVRLPKLSSVLAWNPQTSIINYYKGPVQEYLRAIETPEEIIVSSDWKAKVREWRINKIDLELWGSRFINNNHFSLVLQNKTDWHLDNHLMKWIDTDSWVPSSEGDFQLYRRDSQHIILVGDFAEGHNPVPKEIISQILHSILVNKLSVSESINYVFDLNS